MHAHFATDFAVAPTPFLPDSSVGGSPVECPAQSTLGSESLWPPRLALLVGGKATRLRPLTNSTPKSLIEVAGKPFLAHQLRLIRAGGIREVVLCCGFCGDQIEDFVGNGCEFDLSITCSHDGDRPLGTGGALRAALHLLGSRFLVMYGDSWLTEPLEPMWRAFIESEKPALMSVFRNDHRWGASNVEYRNGLVLRYDNQRLCPTMRHIDYGLEALDASILTRWAIPFFGLADLWTTLAGDSLLAGYETAGRFYEIGSFSGLRETEEVVAATAPLALLPSSRGFPSPQRRARGVWPS
jgi:NDP-sugar pyrophosphorylase family protein